MGRRSSVNKHYETQTPESLEGQAYYYHNVSADSQVEKVKDLKWLQSLCVFLINSVWIIKRPALRWLFIFLQNKELGCCLLLLWRIIMNNKSKFVRENYTSMIQLGAKSSNSNTFTKKTFHKFIKIVEASTTNISIPCRWSNLPSVKKNMIYLFL